MCNKFKFQHHEVDPNWTLQLRESTEKKRYETPVMEKDVLALSTEYVKSVFHVISIIYEKIKNSKFFRILTTTTQPAHVCVMIAALFIAANLTSKHSLKSDNSLYKFVYAATTAAHFGSQIWMTFASGLSLYFSLPRHHFGEVQKVLFPLYFTITSILSLATLLTHLHLTKNVETTTVLTACFFVEFTVRLYLCDPLVHLICIKNEMEAKHGLGMEVGKLAHNSALFESQEYVCVYKKFRRLHTFIGFSNIACIGLSTAHLYFAVSDINFKS